MNPEAATTGQTETLADALAMHAPLKLAEILQVGSGIARCLGRLHAAGQLHLDLCPAKVLWSRGGGQGDVQLGPPQERGADKQLLGSIDPGFTSPELLQNGTVDARSDLFSLGCVLYAMSTGHGPFWGATPADLARSVRETEPRPVGQLNSRLTAWLAAVIMKLLEKDPARRFDDANQLSDMLFLQASMAGTIRRPPPRSVPDRPAAVRVPINAVLAAAAAEPASGSSGSNGNARHEPPKADDPAALAAEMATLAEVMNAAPTATIYWRRALLAGLCTAPVLIGLALLANGWMQPAASGEGAKPDKAWHAFLALNGKEPSTEKLQPSATRATAAPNSGDPSTATDTAPVSDGPVAFTKTKALGNERNGEEFEELSESLGPVIGFDVTQFEYSGHLAIKSVQAIYRSGQAKRLGATFGTPHGEVTRIEARPGYAVGGLTVRAGSRVDGFKVRFMRQTGRKLNANDAYDSAWVGGSAGKGGKLLGGNGRLVIGIHGRSSRDLDAIGLMQTVEQPSDDSQGQLESPDDEIGHTTAQGSEGIDWLRADATKSAPPNSDRRAVWRGDLPAAQPSDPTRKEAPIGIIRQVGGNVTTRSGKVIGVDLGGSNATDATLLALAAFPEMETLRLNYINISNAGLAPLAVLAKLRDLDLSELEGHAITDEGIEHIKGLTNLESLDLERAAITDAGLRQLTSLKKLRQLWLFGDITDAGMATLKEFPALDSLWLHCPQVTDAGIRHLKGVRLKLLEVGTFHAQPLRLTDEAFQSVASIRKLEQLIFCDAPRLSDAALPQLKRLTNLTTLQCERTAITVEGVEKLQRFLPKLKNVRL